LRAENNQHEELKRLGKAKKPVERLVKLMKLEKKNPFAQFGAVDLAQIKKNLALENLRREYKDELLEHKKVYVNKLLKGRFDEAPRSAFKLNKSSISSFLREKREHVSDFIERVQDTVHGSYRDEIVTMDKTTNHESLSQPNTTTIKKSFEIFEPAVNKILTKFERVYFAPPKQRRMKNE
jgi:hypothetical protein